MAKRTFGEFRKASAEFQAQLNDEVRRLETSVSEDESNRSITPPRLQESTARNDVPQYALEPNSGQHEGAVLAEAGGFEPTGFEPVNGSQPSAENQSSAPVAEVQAGASNGANPTEESSKVKDAHDS